MALCSPTLPPIQPRWSLTHSAPKSFKPCKSGEGRATRDSVSVKHALLYYAKREEQPGGKVLLIRLALPMDGIDEALAKFRTRLWSWSFLILLLAGAVALLISRSYADRIERLREFSRRVAEGDFRPCLPTVRATLSRPWAVL